MSTVLRDSTAEQAQTPDDSHDRSNDPDTVVRPRPSALITLAQAVGVGLVAVLLALILYRAWGAAWNRPISHDGSDMLSHESLVKGIVENGWFLHNPRLNAPFGQNYYDFPQNGEFLQMVLLRIIALFTNSAGLVINLYYFIGFGVLAAVSFVVFRVMRFSALVSAGLALVFDFLPYHFGHGEQHTFRSTYLSVPVLVLVLLWSADWRGRFLRNGSHDPDRRWREQILWGRVAFTFALCMFIGAWETLMTAFSLVSIVILALAEFLRARDWRRLVVGAVGAFGVLGTFVAVSLPSIWYSHVNGPNLIAGNRALTEAQRYGLKIDRMLLPLQGSRIPELNILGRKLLTGYGAIGDGEVQLNFIGAAGFFGLLFALVVGFRFAGRQVNERDPWYAPGKIQRTGAVVVITLVLFGVAGGFSSFTGLAGLKDVRTWGRVAIIIAFFCLCQVGLWAESFRGWVRRRHPSLRWAAAVAVVLLTVLALCDGPPVRRLDYKAVDARWHADNAYITKIEQVMPKNAAVMQIPAWGFPETPPPPGAEYDGNFRAYIADTGTLRWSCCGINGRPWTSWQKQFRNAASTATSLPAMLGMGFTGLYVDTAALADQKPGLAQLRTTIGYDPMVSANGRYQFYDLRPYRKTLNQTDAELRQLAVQAFGLQPPG